MSDLPEDKPKIGRGVRIALFVSLALNLVVAGVVAGAVLKHRFDDGPHSRFDRPGGTLVAALSPSDRRAIGKALRQTLRAERKPPAQRRAEYDAIIAALTAEPYEVKAVRDAIEAQLKSLHGRGELGRDLLLERVSEMSREDRAAYAARLTELLERGPERGRDGRRHAPYRP